MSIRGADIAVYQRGVSYAKLVSLARFVIVKVSQDDWTDSAHREHWAGIRAADRSVVLGGYHFLTAAVPVKGQPFTPSPSPAVQARTFVNALRAANGGTLTGVLVALDWEPFQRYGSHRQVVYRSQPKMAEVRAWVEAFRELEPTHPLLIYSRTGVVGHSDLSTLPGPTFAWVALYNGLPGAAPRTMGRVPVVIHQYGRLRPMSVDGNVYGGTVAQLRALTIPKARPVPPTPAPDPPPSTVTRWCLRLQGLPLRPSPEAEPVALALYGARLLVAAGPSGPGSPADGAPSSPWVEVHALGPVTLTPPLLLRAASEALSPSPILSPEDRAKP